MIRSACALNLALVAFSSPYATGSTIWYEIDSEAYQMELVHRRSGFEAVLEVFQHIELTARERLFEAIRKADQEGLAIHGWRARHHTHRAPRMHDGIVGPADLDQCDDLGPGGGVVGLVSHTKEAG